MNIFERIREDHDNQRYVVNQLVETTGDTKLRSQLFTRLKEELEAHAIAEERAFYKPLIESDITVDKARHSIAEHKEIDDYIEDLESTDMSSSHWLIKAKKLRELLLHHLVEEEREVFQLAGKALTNGQKESLEGKFSKEKKYILSQ